MLMILSSRMNVRSSSWALSFQMIKRRGFERLGMIEGGGGSGYRTVRTQLYGQMQPLITPVAFLNLPNNPIIWTTTAE